MGLPAFLKGFLLAMMVFALARDNRAQQNEVKQLIFPILTSGEVGDGETQTRFETYLIARNLTIFQGSTTTVAATLELFSGSGELLSESLYVGRCMSRVGPR